MGWKWEEDFETDVGTSGSCIMFTGAIGLQVADPILVEEVEPEEVITDPERALEF